MAVCTQTFLFGPMQVACENQADNHTQHYAKVYDGSHQVMGEVAWPFQGDNSATPAPAQPDSTPTGDTPVSPQPHVVAENPQPTAPTGAAVNVPTGDTPVSPQ